LAPLPICGSAVDDQRILAVEQDALEEHGVDELFNTLEKLQWQEALSGFPSNQACKFDGERLGMRWNG
jgi:hypothetical protein